MSMLFFFEIRDFLSIISANDSSELNDFLTPSGGLFCCKSGEF
jgi:hypothetical protein